MNKINYNQTGGFPLDTNNLAFLQNSFKLFNSLGNLAGDLAIISGCEEIGNTISDGVIYIHGEVFDFKGGSKLSNIFIKEDIVSGTFEDGSFKPIEVTRYVTFGSSIPDKTFIWTDFKRVDNLIEQGKKNADFEKRLKALENKKSPVPIGLVAIWGKPANEPIPEGWREYTGLMGVMPMGRTANIHFNGDSVPLINLLNAWKGDEYQDINIFVEVFGNNSRGDWARGKGKEKEIKAIIGEDSYNTICALSLAAKAIEKKNSTYIINENIWNNYPGSPMSQAINVLLSHIEKYELHNVASIKGEFEHTLTIEELPNHGHKYQRAKDYGSASGNSTHHPDLGFDEMETEKVGEDKPHNNMPPYRIVRYIQFVGFN
ncbi:MAG: hypothetical protein ACTTJM_03045 [Bergeyella cardium]